MTGLMTPTVQTGTLKIMDTDATITIVDGTSRMMDAACQRLVDLECLWSRFSPDSELSAINAAAGSPAAVGSDTLACVALATAAWRMTQGLFNPLVHDALVRAGSDRTWEAVAGRDAAQLPEGSQSSSVPGCDQVRIDRRTSTVTIPAGVYMDLGGISKGFAADLVVNLVRQRGGGGVCVDVGGDVCVWGRPPTGDGWFIDVEDPVEPTRTIERVWLVEGAVATSSRLDEGWVRVGTPAHHLIDARAGCPAESGLRSATVVAADGWLAQVAAKAAFMGGLNAAPGILDQMGATAILVDDTGTHHTIGRGAAPVPCPVA